MDQPVAADVYYSTLEERFLTRDGMDLRRSLTGAGLAFDGRIFAFLDADDALVVHLGSAAVTAAVDSGDGERYTPGSRAMREWLRLEFDEEDVTRWDRYLEQGFENARGIRLR